MSAEGLSPDSPARDQGRKLRLVGHKGADAIVPGNTLSSFEKKAMLDIWHDRGKVRIKRTNKPKISPLVVSEKHRAHIPNMYVYLLDFDLPREILNNRTCQQCN